MPDLQPYQTLIVGLIGFGGVIVTLAWNGRLTRIARQANIDHERNTTRIALLEELRMILISCERNLAQLKEREPTDIRDFGVPKYELKDVYHAMLGKIGLLDATEIGQVLRAYKSHDQMMHIIMVTLATSSENDSLRVPGAKIARLAKVLETVIPTLNDAVTTLERKLKT